MQLEPNFNKIGGNHNQLVPDQQTKETDIVLSGYLLAHLKPHSETKEALIDCSVFGKRYGKWGLMLERDCHKLHLALFSLRAQQHTHCSIKTQNARQRITSIETISQEVQTSQEGIQYIISNNNPEEILDGMHQAAPFERPRANQTGCAAQRAFNHTQGSYVLHCS